MRLGVLTTAGLLVVLILPMLTTARIANNADDGDIINESNFVHLQRRVEMAGDSSNGDDSSTGDDDTSGDDDDASGGDDDASGDDDDASGDDGPTTGGDGPTTGGDGPTSGGDSSSADPGVQERLEERIKELKMKKDMVIEEILKKIQDVWDMEDDIITLCDKIDSNHEKLEQLRQEAKQRQDEIDQLEQDCHDLEDARDAGELTLEEFAQRKNALTDKILEKIAKKKKIEDKIEKIEQTICDLVVEKEKMKCMIEICEKIKEGLWKYMEELEKLCKELENIRDGE